MRLAPFDAARAYEHTLSLCYPRRVGTRGERRAVRYLLGQFASLGLKAQRERFAVSHWPVELGGRLAFAGSALLVIFAAWCVSSVPAVAGCCWVLAALLVNAPWQMHRLVRGFWPAQISSANLLASLPDAAPAPARVIFMAHYDTKSQLLPTGVRVALVCGVTGLCVLMAVLAGASIFYSDVLTPVGAWRLSAVVLLLLAGLLANVTGNRSPGALDNGSAVGTLLELARTWRPEPGIPVEVIWVATGSEEVELDGACHLLRTHPHWWQDRPTLVINLESVGAGSRVYLCGEAGSLALAREVAGELGVPCAALRVLGAGMDHEPFAARGLPAVSILGDVVRHSFAMHSRRDNMRLIQPPALERAGTLAAHLAWRWAKLHQ